MKTMQRILSLLCTLALFVITPLHAADYAWTPDGTPGGVVGGSGTWSQTGTTWWNGTDVISAGGSAGATFGTADENGNLQFAGSGTITKIGAAYFGNNTGRSHTLSFLAGSDYTILGAIDNSAYIGYGKGHMYYNVAASATLTIGGDGNFIGIITDSDISNGPGIVLSGGGVVNFRNGALVRNNSTNSRLTVRDGIAVYFGEGTKYIGQGGSFTADRNADARIHVEHGSLIVDGATLISGYRASSDASGSRGFGILLGGVNSGAGGVFTLNSGTVVALGDPRAAGGSYGGVIFGTANGNVGGVFDLNGGALVTNSIRTLPNMTGSAIVNLNGGVVMVTSELSPGHATTITDEQLQARLDNFIEGFSSGTGTKYINAGAGGAIFDTTLIDAARTNGMATIRSAIQGIGGLEKRGDNTLHLAARTTYTGTTLVAGGALKLGVSDAIAASGAVFVSASGVLDFSGTAAGVYYNQSLQNLSGEGLVSMGNATLAAANSADTVFGGAIAGAGHVVKTGTGSLMLTAARGYGNLTVNEGALIGSAASLQGAILNNAELVFDQVELATHLGVISGSGALRKIGAGELTLGTAGDYTGATIINEGMLKAGAAGVFVSSTSVEIGVAGKLDLNNTAQTAANLSGAGEVALGGGVLTVRGTEDTTFAGAISGAGMVIKDGAGRLTLAGNNTYANGTRIDDGVLAGDSASLQGAVDIAAPSAGLVFEQATDGIFAGALSGYGAFIKNGAGALTLSGGNAGFAGATTLNAGSLWLSGAGANLGGVTTVKSGGLIGGAGTFTALVLEAGGVAQIGVDALFAQTLTVTNALDLTSGTLRFDLFGGGVSDALNVGSLVSAGSTIIDITTFESGTYFLGENLGTLSASGSLAIKGVLVADGMRQSGSLFDEGGKLKLVTTAGGSLDVVWTGASDNLWNTTSSDWSGVGDGRFADRDHVTFGGSGSQAIVIDPAGVMVAEMVVEGSGTHQFSGGAITGDGSLVYGGATLTGTSGKLIKTGAGKLVLANGTNDFKGGVDLDGGVLALDAGATLGNGTLSITGHDTTIEALGDFSLGNTLALGAHDTSVHAAAGVTATLSGTIGGSGTLSKTGDGMLVLSAANTHAGTRLAAGSVVIRDAAALGDALTIGGANTTVCIDAGQLAIMTTIDLGAAGTTLDTQAHDATLAGAISGAQALVKSGSGTLTLTADNPAFTGALVIGEGTVRVNSAAALGGAALEGAGRLDIDAAGEFAFASPAAAGNFTGIASVSSGSLSLDAVALDTLADATLALSSGSGYATVNATGTLAALEMDGGTLRVAMHESTPVNMLTVDALTVSSGKIAVDVPVPDGATGIVNPPVPPNPGLFDLDISTGAKLLSARTVAAASVGSTLNLTQLDGTPINSPTYADVNQDGQLAARATYNY